MIIVWRNSYDAAGYLDTFLDPVIGNPPARRGLFAKSVERYPPVPCAQTRINPGIYLYVECGQKTEEENAQA